MALETYIITESAGYDAVGYSSQRMEFYANGRFWVFYARSSRIKLKTSVDGETWSDEAEIPINVGIGVSLQAKQFSVHFDGTYFHYAYARGSTNDAFVYRMGTPNADGTITWAAAEQTILPEPGMVYHEPTITTDTDGYPWVGYRRQDGANYYPWAAKSSTNDGTWTTDFVQQLSAVSTSFWRVSIVSLSSNEIYVICMNYNGGWAIGKLYDGGWGAQETVHGGINFDFGCAVADSNDAVHFVNSWNFVGDKYGIAYTKRTHATGTWADMADVVPEFVDADTSRGDFAPTISYDRGNNEIWCFWTYHKDASFTSEVNCARFDGAVWGDTHPVMTMLDIEYGYQCSVVYEDLGEKIAFVWTGKTPGPPNRDLFHVLIDTPARHTLTVDATPKEMPFTISHTLQNPDFDLSDEPQATPFAEELNVDTHTVTMPVLRRVNDVIAAQPDALHAQTSLRWQYKGFYAAGRLWLFYTSETDFYFTSSDDDGATWEASVKIYDDAQYNYGEVAGIWFDGVYVHATVKDGNFVYYRRGLPNADGTITWAAAFAIAFTAGGGGKTDHFISVDSEGYPFIAWAFEDLNPDTECLFTKSSRNDGVWATAGGFPKILFDAYIVSRGCAVYPLPDQDMLILAYKAITGGEEIRCRVWDHSLGTLGALEQASEFVPWPDYITGAESWSWWVVVDDDGDAHLIYLHMTGTDTFHIRYRKRSYATGTWGAESTIVTNIIDIHCSPVLCLDRSTGNMLLFFVGKGLNKHRIYTLAYIDGTWEVTPTMLIDEGVDELIWSETATGEGDEGSSGIMATFHERIGDYIGLYYTTGKLVPPFNIKSLRMDKIMLQHDLLDVMLPGGLDQYNFVEWQEDGTTDRAKTINLTENTAWTAEYREIVEGVVGTLGLKQITGTIEVL